jgi:hypothetical protein
MPTVSIHQTFLVFASEAFIIKCFSMIMLTEAQSDWIFLCSPNDYSIDQILASDDFLAEKIRMMF